MPQAAITVEQLSKAYRIGLKDEMPDTIIGATTSWLKAPLSNFHRLRKLDTFSSSTDDQDDVVWALNDVSFTIPQGQVVGVIGRNGAGKSTLLKILSRITEPTRGRAVINGRVSSLLEVGTGFHPELTGRENVYMNGTILGMKKKEIDAKFDEMVAFSGVERFLDTPIKRYSSGMKVRLAFSVAAHLEPEILIVDEVLAVGDADFQKKCLGKMKNVAGHGRTVLFVSHNMGAVSSLCDRGIVLYQGRVAIDDRIHTAISQYNSELAPKSESAFREDDPFRVRGGAFHFTSAEMLDDQGRSVTDIISGRDVEIVLDYENPEHETSVNVLLTIIDSNSLNIAHIPSSLTNERFDDLGTNGKFRCRIPKLPLMPGHYRVAIAAQIGGETHDLVPAALEFDVVGSEFFPGGRTPVKSHSAILLDHEWNVNSDQLVANP